MNKRQWMKCVFCKRDKALVIKYENKEKLNRSLFLVECDACGARGPVKRVYIDAISSWEKVDNLGE